MQINMAVVSIIFAAMLSSIIALLVWLVRQTNDSTAKRLEMRTQIDYLADRVHELVVAFEKMRDKMQEHIENSDCRRR